MNVVNINNGGAELNFPYSYINDIGFSGHIMCPLSCIDTSSPFNRITAFLNIISKDRDVLNREICRMIISVNDPIQFGDFFSINGSIILP
jgi:hypothetical protein